MKKLSANQLEKVNGGICILGGFGSCQVKSRTKTYTNEAGQACHRDYFESRVFWASIDGGYGEEHCI